MQAASNPSVIQIPQEKTSEDIAFSELQQRFSRHFDEIFLDDVLFNPVSTKFVCDILKNIDFLEENIGIYNLANDGVVSHFDYGKYIANYLNLSISINQRHNFEKPFCNHGSFLMSLDKIKKYVKVNHWKHDMDIFLSSYKGFFDV
jgi:dTDP-4-dehydrorhamnose reductase